MIKAFRGLTANIPLMTGLFAASGICRLPIPDRRPQWEGRSGLFALPRNLD
jgi:hypothetical protein